MFKFRFRCVPVQIGGFIKLHKVTYQEKNMNRRGRWYAILYPSFRTSHCSQEAKSNGTVPGLTWVFMRVRIRVNLVKSSQVLPPLPTQIAPLMLVRWEFASFVLVNLFIRVQSTTKNKA